MREDIETLIKRNKIKTLGFKKSYIGLEKILKDNEKVLYVCNGNFKVNNNNDIKIDVFKIKGKKPAVFAISDNRLIFYFKVLLSEDYTQIPIKELREYNFKRDGISGGVLRITTLTKSFDLDLNYKKETMEAITNALEEARKGISSMVIPEKSDVVDKIRKLSHLKDEGIISEKEFEAKKLELLERI